MSFGFSVGDFIAVGGVIADIISCLKDSTGSKVEYQELVRELETLGSALKTLDKLPTGSPQSTTVNSIKCAALSCRVPLEQFMTKIRKYEPSLGLRPSTSGPKTILRKLTWLNKADDIDRLRKYLDVHLGSINILLLEHGLQTLDVTSKLMQDQCGDIQDSLKRIGSAVAATSADVRHQTSLVQASQRMISTLYGMVGGELQSTLVQITRATQNASILAQKIFEAILQLQTSISTIDTRWTYLQAPAKVEDALGRVFPVPSEYSMCDLHALIRERFRKGPGRSEIKGGHFKLIDRKSKALIDRSSMPQLLPGLDIIMSIIVEVANDRSEVCPITQCSSSNTIPATWGGRTCLDCGRWFDENLEADTRPRKAPRLLDSEQKTRVEELDDDSSASEFDDARGLGKRKRASKGNGKSLDSGHFRNVTCLRQITDPARLEDLNVKECREPGCNKKFKRPCDLTKHEKNHSRPWKCPVPACKYHEYGWPTEKEMDRHHNDKHSATSVMYECLYKPCPYKSKREANCKQHMEKAHGWTYVRTKTSGRRLSRQVTKRSRSASPQIRSAPTIMEWGQLPTYDFIPTPS